MTLTERARVLSIAHHLWSIAATVVESMPSGRVRRTAARILCDVGARISTKRNEWLADAAVVQSADPATVN